VEYDVYSEEILVRINKSEESAFNLKTFFNALDDNIYLLNIKSYSAAMPTLEDVFLNVSAEVKHDNEEQIMVNKIEKINNQEKDEKNKGESWSKKLIDPADYSYDRYDRSVEGEITGAKMFCAHMKACLMKRFLQIVRDKKTFVLEVFCPILLVFIGLIVTSVKLLVNSDPRGVSMNSLPTPQMITVNNQTIYTGDIPPTNVFQNNHYEQFNFVAVNMTDTTSALVSLNNILFENVNSTSNLAGYQLLNSDMTNGVFDLALLVNTVSQDGVEIFLQDIFSNIISSVLGKSVEINVKNKNKFS
jgi:hypothetical protein